MSLRPEADGRQDSIELRAVREIEALDGAYGQNSISAQKEV